ncbi:MAG TPA: FGGY-family carbohydrate kinase [Pararhizobium sp.]|nr:FGGY-family carbohydrate kinase [Pararhizobium sp.]
MRRHVAVIDIGKTNAKVVLVDLASLSEVAVQRTPNRVLTDGPYPHFDHEHLWRFIIDSLRVLNRERPIEAISVTAHGATAALLDANGTLALPILDYEHDGPDTSTAAYEAVRPPFAETGSPRLPGGLNLGRQLFWQARTCPQAFADARTILTYPQYWSFRLSGTAAAEVTSLGCHTDLWNPEQRDYSTLVDRMDWRRLMPPLRRASDPLATITAEVAEATGIARHCPVLCGIHDSNASLLPHLLARQPPFTVVSTGTWVISMAVGGRRVALDEGRDTLTNVDAFGDAVPSARFMGGREFALTRGEAAADPTEADLARIIERQTMLLPALQAGNGPYPDSKGRWIGDLEKLTPGERTAAFSAYLGLMAATCLSLIGADGPTLLEGPLAGDRVFARILADVTARLVIAGPRRTTGTSLGAALLADLSLRPSLEGNVFRATGEIADTAIAAYAAQWSAAIADGLPEMPLS